MINYSAKVRLANLEYDFIRASSALSDLSESLMRAHADMKPLVMLADAVSAMAESLNSMLALLDDPITEMVRN